MHFEVQLVDKAGLANKTPPKGSIYVYEDMLPEVSLLEPDRLKANEEVVYDGTETITVPFEATDDFGIREAELLVSVAEPGQEPQLVQTVPIALGDQQNSTAVQAEAEVDLSKLNLKDDAQVSYTIRVTDNRDLAPYVGTATTTNQEDADSRGEAPTAQTSLPEEMAQNGESQPSDVAQPPAGQGVPTTASSPDSAPNAGNQGQQPNQGQQSSEGQQPSEGQSPQVGQVPFPGIGDGLIPGMGEGLILAEGAGQQQAQQAGQQPGEKQGQ